MAEGGGRSERGSDELTEHAVRVKMRSPVVNEERAVTKKCHWLGVGRQVRGRGWGLELTDKSLGIIVVDGKLLAETKEEDEQDKRHLLQVETNCLPFLGTPTALHRLQVGVFATRKTEREVLTCQS